MNYPNLKQLALLYFLTGIPFQSYSQQTIAEWNFPNNPDDATVDIAMPVNTSAVLLSQGGTSIMAYTQTGASTFAASATGWQSGMNSKWWEISINTTSFKNLTISSKQFSSSTGPRDFKIQYRIGAGAWTDLPGALNIIVSANFTSGIVSAVPLPAICENQPLVVIRWIMTSNTSVGLGTVASGGNSRIDEINISWNSDEYFRSVSSGDWSNVACWESSPDNISWSAAVMSPSNFAKNITVRNSHNITISSNVNLDETVVENGATLEWLSFFLIISNGPGIDLNIEGTFKDGSSNSVQFNTGATWSLGGAATFIKTNMGSANNWRDAYDGGITNINPTAAWIIRKTSGNNPTISSLNMVYPNLIIENNTASNWIATGPSSFQGTTSTILIKGILDIGGSGNSAVEFENSNTNASPVAVNGNLIIRSGNTLRNYGTGFELFSDLICDGNLIYDSNGMKKLIFSGTSAQNISGAGNLNIYNLELNKINNDVTFLRPVKVDNNILFNNPGGRIFSSISNVLIIDNNATVSGTNNTGFVHGPVRKIGGQSFIFPVGKNNNFQSISIGAGPVVSNVFWYENFGSGCNTGQHATDFNGSNGLWSITLTGTNDDASNTWFISAAENGQPIGMCGTTCGNNQTLHVGSTFPVADAGASYYESTPGICPGILPCSYTDKRVESPVTDCSGKSNITLSFNYIEFGEGLNDNTFLWYYDGITWNQLFDLPKTLCCSNATCDGTLQGLWSPFSIALPASANNNPNVRIGFRWINNANGIGTDPAFAVDDIQLSGVDSLDIFTAEYFYDNPQTTFNNSITPFIDHISLCEYWLLSQDAGNSSRTVTLAWDGNSCGINTIADLTVARFDGSAWKDEGNGGATGNVLSGTISSFSSQNYYGPYTLASTTLNNPLPVELLNLSATYVHEKVIVEWSTATEINSNYFQIERSIDGLQFEEIGRTNASGNSTTIRNYIFYDEIPLPGISYYRLRMIDLDGMEKVSEIVAVKSVPYSGQTFIENMIVDSGTQNILLYVASEINTQARIEIIDRIGKVLLKTELNLENELNFVSLPLKNASKGIYFIKIHTARNVIIKKFNY